jgi:hypothetical protein
MPSTLTRDGSSTKSKRKWRMSSKPTKETYKVGFGKPPLQTQFKAGRSGNPQGRPKGRLNLITVLERTLQERVVINENGQRKTITKLEAAVKQLSNKAANGDMNAFKQLSALVCSADNRAEEKASSKQDLAEQDRRNMQRMMARYVRS